MAEDPKANAACWGKQKRQSSLKFLVVSLREALELSEQLATMVPDDLDAQLRLGHGLR